MTMRPAMDMTTQHQDFGIEAIGAAITGSSGAKRAVRLRGALSCPYHLALLGIAILPQDRGRCRSHRKTAADHLSTFQPSTAQLIQKFGLPVQPSPRSRRGIVANREHDVRRGKWGRVMTAGDYVAAAVLIVLILWGVKGVLTQDKFRL